MYNDVQAFPQQMQRLIGSSFDASRCRLESRAVCGAHTMRPFESRGRGVREAFAPIMLGKVARISMILDPDCNKIELSGRASTVGSVS